MNRSRWHSAWAGGWPSMGIALALVAAVYIPIALERPSDVFWSPDQGGKLLQVWALIEGRYDLSINYPGQWLDPGLEFRPYFVSFIQNGVIQMPWPIAWALPTALFYATLGGPGLVVVPLAGGLLAAWSAGRLAERIVAGSGWLAVLLAGLATPLLPFSTLFWEHAPTAGLFAAGLALLPLRGRAASRTSLLLAGICFGLAIAWRNETALYVLAGVATWLVLGGERRRRDLAWLSSGLLLILLAVISQRWAETAAPARTMPIIGQLSGPASQSVLSRGLTVPADFLVGARHGLSLPDALRWAPSAGLALLIAGHWTGRRWRRWLQLSGLLLAGSATAWLLASPVPQSVHGFLIAAPFLALILLRPPTLWATPTGKLLLVAPIMSVAAYVSVSLALHPRGVLAGGIEWGPRYLLPLYPALTALASAALFRLAERKQRPELLAGGLLAALALAFQIAGLGSIDLALQQAGESGRAIASLPPDPIVFRSAARPLLTPGLTQSRTLFCAQTPAALKRWSELAQRAGLERFWYVDYDPLESAWLLPGLGQPARLAEARAGPLRAISYQTAIIATSLRDDGAERPACSFSRMRF